jgi:hypothetical protein
MPVGYYVLIQYTALMGLAIYVIYDLMRHANICTAVMMSECP